MKKIFQWLLCTLCSLPMHGYALDIMLPQVFTDDRNVVGWLMSEKLDGVRGYWDGSRLFSKNGNPFYPPKAFTTNFPPFPLEGELWAGREAFEKTVSIVKKQQPHDGWFSLQFMIFDVPQTPGGFTHRLQQAQDWFGKNPTEFAAVIPQKIITDNEQLKAELKRVEELGGEGLIVRKDDSLYVKGRTDEILKVKSFFDMEAVVIAHIKGQGKNKGRLGSLLVELVDKRKTRFKIGTGFSNAERDKPPAIGSIITFKYYGFYRSGIPKFPSFLRIRTDSPL